MLAGVTEWGPAGPLPHQSRNPSPHALPPDSRGRGRLNVSLKAGLHHWAMSCLRPSSPMALLFIPVLYEIADAKGDLVNLLIWCLTPVTQWNDHRYVKNLNLLLLVFHILIKFLLPTQNSLAPSYGILRTTWYYELHSTLVATTVKWIHILKWFCILNVWHRSAYLTGMTV